MALIDPVLAPVAEIPDLSGFGYLDFPQVQPFSQRTASGYQESLESILFFLQRKLIPYLTVTNPQTTWDANVTALIAAVEAALTQQTTDNAQKIADALTELAESSITITDPAILVVLQSATSQTRVWLDAHTVSPDELTEALEPTAFLPALFTPAPATDSTASINAALAAVTQGTVRVRPGTYPIAGTVTIPDDVTFDARGAVFVLSGTGTGFALGNRSALIGAEINGGTRTTGQAVRLNGVTGASVLDCFIHDIAGTSVNDGRGISVESGSTRYVLRGNRIDTCHAQGIDLDGSSFGTIDGNDIHACYHGIQWWGGDSASSSTIGIHHLVITGNTVRNVQGGIWGALGQFITVVGNLIDTCGDVGIDFEGCTDCTATGNTVVNCTNAALAVFYAASRILFADNSVYATGTAGAGFKAFTSNTSTYITVRGNLFITDQGNAITGDVSALGDSSFTNNRIIGVTQNITAVRFIDCGNLTFSNNEIRCANKTAISWEGCTDGRVENNEIITLLDGTAPGATSAGVYLVWRSATWPCKRNRVRHNTIRGFVQAIFDDCWNDHNAYNLIEGNVASHITYRNGSTSFITGNLDETTHAAGVVAGVA